MKVFEELTRMLEHTDFFNKYVSYWPEPLNDASFDVFCIIVFAVLVVIPELYYALEMKAAKWKLKKKNIEYAKIAADSDRAGKKSDEMELIDQYLKFLLVAHCIDKDIDISFEEWKEVKYGDGVISDPVVETPEENKGNMFSSVGIPKLLGIKNLLSKNPFKAVKKQEKSKEEIAKMVIDVEKSIGEEKDKDKETSLEDIIGIKDKEEAPVLSEDGLDDFERILNSIKLKQNEKMRIRNKERLSIADEKKKRLSLEKSLVKTEADDEVKKEVFSDDRKIYDAKETALKLKEKEFLRKKRLEERRLRKEEKMASLKENAG